MYSILHKLIESNRHRHTNQWNFKKNHVYIENPKRSRVDKNKKNVRFNSLSVQMQTDKVSVSNIKHIAPHKDRVLSGHTTLGLC